MIEEIKVAKLKECGILPSRKNRTDAGIDFYVPNEFPRVVIPPHGGVKINTFVTVQIPEGYMMLIKPKGRNIHLTGSGVIDAYYEPGPIIIRVVNPFEDEIILEAGQAFAQGVLLPVATPKLIEVSIEEMNNESDRSNTGGILGVNKWD